MNRSPESGGRRPPRHAGLSEEVRSVADIWGARYLDGGYFDAAGHLRLEYVSREKVDPLVAAMAKAHPPLTAAQLRRFFQHCRRLESRLKMGLASWEEVRPQVVFLDAAAQDAFGKTPRKIPEVFFDFVRRNTQAVRTEDDFLRGFLPHFEALVGFGSAHVRRQER
jgi:CRISPR type III-A-associated protein Csm2